MGGVDAGEQNRQMRWSGRYTVEWRRRGIDATVEIATSARAHTVWRIGMACRYECSGRALHLSQS